MRATPNTSLADDRAHRIVRRALRRAERAAEAAARKPGEKRTHALRICTRKAQTALRTLGGEGERSRRMSRRLARVRRRAASVRRCDAHAALLERLAHDSETPFSPIAAVGAEWLSAALARERRGESRRLRRTCARFARGGFARDGRRIVRSVRRGRPADLAEVARLAARAGGAALRARLGSGGHDLEGLHRLRVELKHARYAIELLGGAEGEPAARRLARVQNLLGDINDLGELRERALAADARALPAGAPGALADDLGSRLDAARQRVSAWLGSREAADLADLLDPPPRTRTHIQTPLAAHATAPLAAAGGGSA
jgi:CHAD domain-containing protein